MNCSRCIDGILIKIHFSIENDYDSFECSKCSCFFNIDLTGQLVHWSFWSRDFNYIIQWNSNTMNAGVTTICHYLVPPKYLEQIIAFEGQTHITPLNFERILPNILTFL